MNLITEALKIMRPIPPRAPFEHHPAFLVTDHKTGMWVYVGLAWCVDRDMSIVCRRNSIGASELTPMDEFLSRHDAWRTCGFLDGHQFCKQVAYASLEALLLDRQFGIANFTMPDAIPLEQWV